MTKQIFLAATILLLSACSGSDNAMLTDGDASNGEPGNSNDNSSEDSSMNGAGGDNDASVPDGTTATYRVTFNATWSAQTHPLQFPQDPHFSPLVGAVHNEQVQFWMSGQLATEGIELMAETGGTSALLNEVNNAIASGYADIAVEGGGIATSPGSTSVEFTVSATYPLVTLVTMVAPSPDWFVGVHNLSLVADGAFVDNLSVDLAVYDAGTDSGSGYTSANIDTINPEPIGLLTSQPADAPFQNGQPFMGQLVFEKL